MGKFQFFIAKLILNESDVFILSDDFKIYSGFFFHSLFFS